MALGSAYSINGVLIRLTEERWKHILKGHQDLIREQATILRTIAEPHVIYEGEDGELLAVREIREGKYLVVVSKETFHEDGFIITAHYSRRLRQLERRRKLWTMLPSKK